MAQVPFLFVNIAAFCCFFLLFLTFAAAKKSAEVKSFMVLLATLMIWSGASVLMRLQVRPGVDFWFYVSILALFAIALVSYLFICCFVRQKGFFMKLLLSGITLVILVLTACGLFIQPPVPTTLENGRVIFSYSVGMEIVIPLVLLLCIVAYTSAILVSTVKKKGLHFPGLIFLISGCVVMALGNMLSILPGNVFPWDMLSGIICAGLLAWAMYKKHLFHLTLIVSRSLLLLVMAVVFAAAGAHLIIPVHDGLVETFKLGETAATTIVSMAFAFTEILVFFCMRAITDTVFSSEKNQDKMLESFLNSISRSLDLNEVVQKLADTVKAEIPVSAVYILLPDESGFTTHSGTSGISTRNFSIAANSPCIECLSEQDGCILMDEFMCMPIYQSLWQAEKILFKQIDLGCMVALKDGDSVVGLVLIPNKERGGKFSYLELSFLTTISSITSIAIKNASLYERMYREARIDSLTGVYNYSYFVEKINSKFEECRGDSLALIYVDIDDFKLYNQLYGSAEGDRALVSISGILSQCVGANGDVFRTSGKVFALLMPGYDGRKAEKLASEIQSRVLAINSKATHLKTLSVSCGICISPYAAGSAKELMDNADLAVFNAKNSGKKAIKHFEGTNNGHSCGPREKAMRIAHSLSDSSYQENAAAISALTATIDSKDHYTFQHSRNVARYASILAAAYGLNDEQLRMIYEAGLLHDIGKISIDESILRKTSDLTEEEFDIMKSHVNNSINIIRYLSAMDYLVPAVVGHHERWDGRGYPRGISGTEIPISARCLAVADAFDAMTTNRSYRKSLPIEYACSEIERGAGTQFDPELAMLFVELVKNGEIALEED